MISLASMILFAITSFHGGNMTQTQHNIFLPVPGAVVTSLFGYRVHPQSGKHEFHSGIDLAAPESSAIRSVGTGRVIYAGIFRGYGNLIVIRHVAGITSHYAHCKHIGVSIGQVVRGGELIGAIGSTGTSTGPHLHFELRRNGRPVDPLRAMPKLKSR